MEVSVSIKTKVFFETFKGNKMFSVWEVDDNGNKVGDYPIMSMGSKKASVVHKHVKELESFVLGTKLETN